MVRAPSTPRSSGSPAACLARRTRPSQSHRPPAASERPLGGAAPAPRRLLCRTLTATSHVDGRLVVLHHQAASGRVRCRIRPTAAVSLPASRVLDVRGWGSLCAGGRLRRARLSVPVVLDLVAVSEEEAFVIGDADQDCVLVGIEGAHWPVGLGGEDDQPGWVFAVVAKCMGAGGACQGSREFGDAVLDKPMDRSRV